MSDVTVVGSICHTRSFYQRTLYDTQPVRVLNARLTTAICSGGATILNIEHAAHGQLPSWGNRQGLIFTGKCSRKYFLDIAIFSLAAHGGVAKFLGGPKLRSNASTTFGWCEIINKKCLT